MNQEKETFSYTYSAKEQAEIRRIRGKYAPGEEEKREEKLAKLRRLDAKVTERAMVLSLTAGILGALLLGFGMSLAMSELAMLLGLSHIAAWAVGIPVGLGGIGLICLAYPLYNYVLKKERERVAPEILRLTDELMK